MICCSVSEWGKNMSPFLIVWTDLEINSESKFGFLNELLDINLLIHLALILLYNINQITNSQSRQECIIKHKYQRKPCWKHKQWHPLVRESNLWSPALQSGVLNHQALCTFVIRCQISIHAINLYSYRSLKIAVNIYIRKYLIFFYSSVQTSGFISLVQVILFCLMLLTWKCSRFKLICLMAYTF